MKIENAGGERLRIQKAKFDKIHAVSDKMSSLDIRIFKPAFPTTQASFLTGY